MRCDVLVVGSGPAGVSAARALKGMDVVVLERLSEGPFARYHSICGEAVSDRMLERAGVGFGDAVAAVDTISISFPGGVEIRIPVKGHVMDRPSMLRTLRRECDARFVRGTATSVREDGDGYVVSTTAEEIRCRYLIGADGAHSVVRRDLFGTRPAGMIPVVNTIVPGEGGSVLGFTVGEEYGGLYTWRFPSHPGTVSVGLPKGASDPEETLERGARDLPYGGVPETVRGNALLVGDAAGMANAICYGGIGVAMLSGIRAAAAVRDGKPSRYARWCRRCIYTNHHFLEAHESFRAWTDEEIMDAMEPFRNGYSIWRGLYAILRRPSFSNVYFSVWIAFRQGW